MRIKQYIFSLYSLYSSLFMYLTQVYCEMGLNGGGYAFIHPSDLSRLADTELQAIFKDRANFLLRVTMTDGTQPYGVLAQLPAYA